MIVTIASAFFFFTDLCAWILLDRWLMRSLLVYASATIARGNNVLPALTLLFLESILFYDNVILAGIFTFLFAVGAQQLTAWLFVGKRLLTYFLVTWGIIVESALLLWGLPLEPALYLAGHRLIIALATTVIVNLFCATPKTQ